MGKYKIETNKEEFFDDNEENDIINYLSKQDFLKILSKNGFDDKILKRIFEEKKVAAIEQNKFNVVLRKIKKETGINIYEMILYMESSINRLRKIILVLDEETTAILKQELSKKYKIKVNETFLYKLIKY